MLHIGCHLSASKGYLHMGREALSIGANTFQFFTRNPRGGSAKALDEKDVAAYLDFAAANGIGTVLAHAPYTLNGCSADPAIRDFATRTMLDDLRRMEHTPGNLYNFHPGSHVGQGIDAGVEQIAAMLNAILWPEMRTTVLLETMAGKGSEVGGRFEELRAIIDRVELSNHMGVCLDTCHVHDAGYDIVGDLEGVLEAFDKVIGLNRLKAIHVNDSKNPVGARKDRHEKLGEGCIGLEALVRVVNHPALRELPFLLETPNELDGYAREIAVLKERYA
ncbi:MAG: deoxyribonuclease IV [Christensenellaceae bacterium]|nr:deoxyribonuclease IV [Christensenellaceae bacterium]